jgi:two-component system OmpR family response regulator
MVAEARSMTSFRPIRVLVVDDDVNALSALGALLREPSREVVLAHDGIDALVKLATFHPDVIVADVNMPRMDGQALYDAVLRLPMVTPRFIFMSAMARPDVDGNVRFVSKPIAIERLATLVDDAAHAMHQRPAWTIE